MKQKTIYKTGFFILLILCILSLFAVLFLLFRGHYFEGFQRAMSHDTSYDYTANASYEQRVTQFEMLQTKDCDVAFVGDSITQRFNYQEYFTDLSVCNRGIDSDVSEGLLNRLDTVVDTKPEKVFLMIGINDVFHEIPIETTVDNDRQIIEQIKNTLPDCEIYIESVLPVNKSTGIDNATVAKLNENLKLLAKEQEVTYIDLYSLVIDENQDFPYTVDGVHPTGEGYEIIMNALEPFVYESSQNAMAAAVATLRESTP